MFILVLGSYESLGFLFSYILSMLLMPILFLFIYGKTIDAPRFDQVFSKTLINCLRFVTVFGLILFMQKILTGKSLEIPYLTVNIDDLGGLDEKYNLRGDIMKYTSTYNNGNILGICLLIFMPIYFSVEKKYVFKIIFLASLALTLSRTVWFGMLLFGLLSSLKNIKTKKGIFILIFSGVSVVIFVPLLLKLINVDTSFLFDANLGGRLDQLSVLSNLTLFGDGEFNGIAEIIYTSILQEFGIIGLILFIPYLLSPLIIYYFSNRAKTDRNYHWGLLIYPVICLSDGAILLIPTMAFYWFLASYALIPRREIDNV